jgi:hypothetical protein
MRQELHSRAYYKARQESRLFIERGYFVAPGALPLDKQIERAWIHQYEIDDDGQPQYIVATANAVAESQIAARIQAMEAAKLEIASSIASELAALVENSIANYQTGTEDAVSLTKTVVASKTIVAQELGRTLPLVEAYRYHNGTIEASVRIAYDTRQIRAKAKQMLRNQLEQEADALQGKLDYLLGLDF